MLGSREGTCNREREQSELAQASEASSEQRSKSLQVPCHRGDCSHGYPENLLFVNYLEQLGTGLEIRHHLEGLLEGKEENT